MSTSTLTLTGQTLRGKYLVSVDGNAVGLTNAQFVALCDLVLARLTTCGGRTALADLGTDRNGRQVTVHRLRQALNAALGAGAAEALILPAGRGEYLLAVPRERLLVREDIAELAPHHLHERLVRQLVTAAAGHGLLGKRSVSAL